MYKPWKPIERVFSTHPSIDWCVEGRTVKLIWAEWLNNICQFEMEIQFNEGIAGIYCFDESTYQTTVIHPGVPSEVELYKGEFKPIPWPAWKSELNYRKHLYGDLGAALYEDMYSYYIVGSETVILLDIADSEPVIEVKCLTHALR